MIEVSQLMPTHIKQGEKRHSQINLARDALSRLAARVENGIVISIPKNTRGKYDHYLTVQELLLDDNTLQLPVGRGKKENEAFRKWIKSRGAKNIAPGRYSLTGTCLSQVQKSSTEVG